MLVRVLAPAIVIRGDRQRDVPHLRLARQKRFRHIGHAHNIAPRRTAQEMALNLRTQTRPLDTRIRLAGVKLDANIFGGL